MTTERLYKWRCNNCHDDGECYSIDEEDILDKVSDHVYEYSTKCSLSDVEISEFFWVRDIDYNSTRRGIWENKYKDPDKCAICDKDG